MWRKMIDLVGAQIRHNQRGLPAIPTITMVDGTWVDYPSLSKD
jgi:hypothetical protein